MVSVTVHVGSCCWVVPSSCVVTLSGLSESFEVDG